MTAVRVHLPQQFTPEVAGAIHRLAGRAPPGTVLDLDFSGVRSSQDLAFVLLAGDVASGEGHFVFHGLTHHQERLLGYLGAVVVPPSEADTG